MLEAAERSLTGRRRGVAALMPFLGPAFIAAVAYVDPGNFATNIAAGAKFGYALLWVVLAANLMAMIVQSLSAKLGIATGKNLAEVCRDRFSRPVTWFLWIQAEAIAMATDLAEFTGAALGLAILFSLPLFLSGLITAVVAFGVLALQERGWRRGEAVITALVGSDRRSGSRSRSSSRRSPGRASPAGCSCRRFRTRRRRSWPSGSSARPSCRT